MYNWEALWLFLHAFGLIIIWISLTVIMIVISTRMKQKTINLIFALGFFFLCFFCCYAFPVPAIALEESHYFSFWLALYFANLINLVTLLFISFILVTSYRAWRESRRLGKTGYGWKVE